MEWLADRILATAERLLGHPGERLMIKITDAVRATVNGTVAAAIAKGAAIGIAYVLTGVPHPLLFVVLTVALAMVPLGAWVALITAGSTLLLQGGTLLTAVGLLCFGAAMLLIGDNFIPAGAHRRRRAAAVPVGADRNSWRDTIVRVGRPFPRPGDHGGFPDRMA
jgi:predicted PurR-regulated permease PerM